MDVVTQHYIVDLSSNNNFVQLSGMQGDGYEVRYAEIELIQNGERYIPDPEEVHVDIMGTKPDTKEVWNICEVTSDGYIKVEITQQMLAVPGRGDYAIVMMDRIHNQQLKSFPFILVTTKAPYDPQYIESSDEFQRLVTVFNTAERYAEIARIEADKAKVSEENAKDSEIAAKASEIAAKASEDAAKVSEDNAKDSEIAAKASEDAAKVSEDAAKASEIASKASEDAAKASEDAAKASEDAAKASEDAAKASEDAAKVSEDNAKASEDAAKVSEDNAKVSEDNAKISEDNAKESEDNAKESEDNAKASEDNAADSALMSKSYAVGTNNEYREGDSEDNSEYYSRMSQNSAQSAQHILEDVIAEGENAVQAIHDALDIDTPDFVMDLETGHLKWQGGRFTFDVEESTGHLMWEIIA